MSTAKKNALRNAQKNTQGTTVAVTVSGNADYAQEIAKITDNVATLKKNLEEAEVLRRTAQNARRNTLLTAITEEKTRHEETLKALFGELNPLEMALGIISVGDIDLPMTGDDNVLTGDFSIPAGAVLKSKRKPKDLDLGVDSNGNAYPDEFWQKLMVWPFQGDESPSSLDNYIALMLYNAGGNQVNLDVTTEAVKHLGHTTKSENLKLAVSTSYNRLKQNGIAKAVGRGLYAINGKKGQKAVEKMIAETGGTAGETSSPKKANHGSLDDYIVSALAQSKEPMPLKGLVAASITLGYKVTNDQDKERNNFQESISRLRSDGVVEFNNPDGKTSIASLTEKGQQRAKELAAAA